jgi:cyanophycinase
MVSFGRGMTMRNFFLVIFIYLVQLNSYALMIHRTGSPVDVIRPTHQATCLAGGGSDQAWGAGWKYLIDNSGGGDIVIVRADGRIGSYENWIYKDESDLKFRPVNSVTTIVLEKAQDANDPKTIKAINEAELIFFAGGDQNLYITWFKNSKLEKAFEMSVRLRNIPVGGTSAGMALLAGLSYRARFTSPTNGGNLTSEDVLNNPTAAINVLESNSISASHLKNVITETHFSERDRFGRIVGLMAKAIYNKDANYSQIKSISSDAGTAFCYNAQGIGHVYGSDAVYFMQGQTPPEILKPEKPLTWDANGTAVDVQILKAGQIFRLVEWGAEEGVRSQWSVRDGILYRKDR